MATEQVKSLDDVGTRREHLMELYDTWMYGLAILSSDTLRSEGIEERRVKLEAATELLWHAFSMDYDARTYVRTIDTNTHPEDIEDKRGTPLIEPPEGYDKPID